MLEPFNGALAFSRSGDLATSEFFLDATLIKRFGDVPDDLSGLLSSLSCYLPTCT